MAKPPEDLPRIVNQPISLTVESGKKAQFIASVVGKELSFQWYIGGIAVPGATGEKLTFDPVSHDDAGSYWLVASNSAGSVASDIVSLIVTKSDAELVVEAEVEAEIVQMPEADFLVLLRELYIGEFRSENSSRETAWDRAVSAAVFFSQNYEAAREASRASNDRTMRKILNRKRRDSEKK